MASFARQRSWRATCWPKRLSRRTAPITVPVAGQEDWSPPRRRGRIYCRKLIDESAFEAKGHGVRQKLLELVFHRLQVIVLFDGLQITLKSRPLGSLLSTLGRFAGHMAADDHQAGHSHRQGHAGTSDPGREIPQDRQQEEGNHS